MDTKKQVGELGSKLAELRRQKGWTQRQLSEACGINISAIGRFEAGLINEFGAGKLVLLLEALGAELTFAFKADDKV